MPVGTLATVKGISTEQLARTGAQMVLSNTYHLHLQPGEKIVAAGGGLNIIFGIGAIAGPIVCSALMNLLGPNGLFVHFLIFFILIIVFGLYRLNQRKYEDNPDSTFTPLPTNITPLGIELDPETGVDLSNTENKKS